MSSETERDDNSNFFDEIAIPSQREAPRRTRDEWFRPVWTDEEAEKEAPKIRKPPRRREALGDFRAVASSGSRRGAIAALGEDVREIFEIRPRR